MGIERRSRECPGKGSCRVSTGRSLTRITIYHLTDLHGRFNADAWDLPILRALTQDGTTQVHGGLSRFEPVLLAETRRRGGLAVLVHCGDLIGIETPHDRSKQGLITMGGLNVLAEAADIEHCFAVVGNHELDCGVEAFLELQRRRGRFRFLASNLEIDDRPVSSTIEEIEIGEFRIALVSLTVELTRDDAPVADKPRLGLVPARDTIAALKKSIEAARTNGADLVAGFVHLPDIQDATLARELGLDLLLGGHSHGFVHQLLGNDTLYAKAGCFAQVMGICTFELSKGRRAVLVQNQSCLVPVLSRSPENGGRVQRHFDDAYAELARDLPNEFAVFASSAGTSEHVFVRRRDCDVGRLVADAVRNLAEGASGKPVHLAFVNGGNIRADLPQEVRAIDLEALVPYGNRIMVAEVPVDVAIRVLRTSVANLKIEPQGFLQLSGITLEIGAEGDLVEPRLVSDPKLRLASLSVVRIATIDYLAAGNHHLEFLRDHSWDDVGPLYDGWRAQLEAERGDGLALIQIPKGQRVLIDDDLQALPVKRLAATLGAGFEWLAGGA